MIQKNDYLKVSVTHKNDKMIIEGNFFISLLKRNIKNALVLNINAKIIKIKEIHDIIFEIIKSNEFISEFINVEFIEIFDIFNKINLG